MGNARARRRAREENTIKSFIRNTADRFRFESLQNRYSKFIELWERQMTNRELGRPMMGAGAGAAARREGPAKEGDAAKAEEPAKAAAGASRQGRKARQREKSRSRAIRR